MPYRAIQITADDLPHITKEEIAQVRSDYAGWPEFADSVLGYGFLPMVQDAVINGKALLNCLANPPTFKDGEVHAFCDFAWSQSGDQNVLAVRRGNRIAIEHSFHAGHLEATVKNPQPGIVDTFIMEFVRLGLEAYQISGDEGGGGKLVMDALDRRGWILTRFNSGAPPRDSEHYVSIGAEMWYEGSKLINASAIILPDDQTLRGQLLSRKRKVNDRGKLGVESKDDMRKRGVPSPDRGDAVLGAAMPGGGYGSAVVTDVVTTAGNGASTWQSETTGERIKDLSPLDDGQDKDLWPEPCYD